MLIIVYEHPTKKTVTKTYQKQDFGTCGDIRTEMGMKEKGYKITTRITIPNDYIKMMKNFRKGA